MIEILQDDAHPLVRYHRVLHDEPDLKVIRIVLAERGVEWYVMAAPGGPPVVHFFHENGAAADVRLTVSPVPPPPQWLRNPWGCYVSASDKYDVLIVLMPASKYCPVESPA